MNEAPAWFGNVVPVADHEAAILYWTTTIPAAEIIEAYAPGCHPNQIATIAGQAFTPFVCKECDEPVRVSSRSRATQMFSARSLRSPISPCCGPCWQKEMDRRAAPYIEAYNRQKVRESELAAMPYREYLQTPEWQERRKDALRRARYCCQMCAGGGQLHVHHRTYIRRGREYASDLIALCAPCHETFHRNRELSDRGRSIAAGPAPTAGEVAA